VEWTLGLYPCFLHLLPYLHSYKIWPLSEAPFLYSSLCSYWFFLGLLSSPLSIPHSPWAAHFTCSGYTAALKMEAVCSSSIQVHYLPDYTVSHSRR
jgi:hypothetical protein